MVKDLNAQVFKSGESVEYSVYYHLAWVWVDAAEVSFSISDTAFGNQKKLHFLSIGRSKSSYDWIFKVRERFSSVVNPDNLNPLWYTRQSKEGSHTVNNTYLFDPEKAKIYSSIKDNSKEKYFSDTIAYNQTIYDILSATYYLRTIDFSIKDVGDTIYVNTVMDNELITLNIIYLGRELVKHKNSKYYSTYKLKTSGVAGSIFDEDSEMFVWVSADENKIPIKVESKILVGSVKAFISSLENPQNPSKITHEFLKSNP